MTARALSDAELERIANQQPQRPQRNPRAMSDEELTRIAGIDAGTAGLRGFGDGLSFSWGDELMGAGAAASGAFNRGNVDHLAEDFHRQAQVSRANLAQAQHDQPLATGAGQLGGAIVSSFVPGGVIGRGVGAASRLGRFGVAIGSGAAVGGLQGAGSGETAEERLHGLGMGAAFGGALGGAAHGVFGEALPALVRGGRRYLANATGMPMVPGRMGVAETAREDLMSTARQNTGLNIRNENDLLREMNAAAARDPTLTTAEVLGASGQGRLAALARAPGQTGQAVEDFFNQRALNQSDEITAAVLGRAPASGDALEQQLIHQWETRGPALYEPILQARMAPGAIARFEEQIAPRLAEGSPRFSPALSEAWGRAGRLIQEDISLGRLPANAASNLPHRLHYTKMALDDMVRDPLSVPSGLRHVTNAQMSAIARHFAETLDNGSASIIPGYAAARGELADIGTARRAIEAGRQAFTNQRFASPAALERHIAQLPAGERPFFLAGSEDALEKLIVAGGRDGRRNVANALLGDQTQARLRAIYGQDAEAMIARIRDVGRKFEFGQRVRPSNGSITSNVMLQNTAAGAGIGALAFKDDPIMGGLTGGALGFGASAAGRRMLSAALLRGVERGAQRQRDLLGRVYLSPASQYRPLAGGLLARARREASRREYQIARNRTRGALYAGMGSAGIYDERDQ